MSGKRRGSGPQSDLGRTNKSDIGRTNGIVISLDDIARLEQDESVPPEALTALREGFVVESFRMVMRSGPLPDPAELEHYKAIDPSIPERLLAAFERQQQHRLEVEKDEHRDFKAARRRGQWMAWSIAIGGLGTACVAAYFHNPFIGVSVVLGVAVAMIAGSAMGSRTAK